MMNKRPVSLYLHFPFCVRKCRYCDFLSFPCSDALPCAHHESLSYNAFEREEYVRRLIKELTFRADECVDHPVRSVFIGGGTPSLMTRAELEGIMNTVFRYYDVVDGAEISMECNPGTVLIPGSGETQRPGTLTFPDIKEAGINRLSIGLQSMNDGELRCLGRIHSSKDFLKSYDSARSAGFENINVDIMSGLPGQSMDSWMDTVKSVCGLHPEHISAYSLIIEEGTPFYLMYGDDNAYPPLPDEDTERDMYHETVRYLGENGYTHYEVSNYARPGMECLHNLTYWYRGDYMGFGLGASSLMDSERFSNPSDMHIYMKKEMNSPSFREKRQILNRQDEIEETMFLGLRCCTGVGIGDFEARFGESIYSVYGPVIDRYKELGMMRDDGTRIMLTEKGIDVSNWILADFLF